MRTGYRIWHKIRLPLVLNSNYFSHPRVILIGITVWQVTVGVLLAMNQYRIPMHGSISKYYSDTLHTESEVYDINY